MFQMLPKTKNKHFHLVIIFTLLLLYVAGFDFLIFSKLIVSMFQKKKKKKKETVWAGGEVELWFKPENSLSQLHGVKVKALVSQSCLTLETPWTVAHQAPLSMEFFRQGYWSGLPCNSPGDLPDPGIEPGSPTLQADSLLSESPGKLPSTPHGLVEQNWFSTVVKNEPEMSKS